MKYRIGTSGLTPLTSVMRQTFTLLAFFCALAVLVVAVSIAADAPPSQTLFGEGYARLYQQDQKMMHEMMESLQDMMGMMKGMVQGADKEKVIKRMERMDALMQEHATRPSQALFEEGYARLYQKDREMMHEMMEMQNEMMGMMKGMVQDPGMKGSISKRMERMDTMMKEHDDAPLKALFGGYPFQQR
jgi:argininosuccinate lyase